METRSWTTKSIFLACSRFLDIESFRRTVGMRNSAPYRAACRSQKQRAERRRQFALAQWPNQNANTRQRVSCCILNRFNSRFASSLFLHACRRLAFSFENHAGSRELELKNLRCSTKIEVFFFLSLFLFFIFGIGL